MLEDLEELADTRLYDAVNARKEKSKSPLINTWNAAGVNMPDYKITITRTAQKQLDKLSDPEAGILIEAIQELASNPRPHGCKKLRGRNGYRIRRGDFRVIYDIYD